MLGSELIDGRAHPLVAALLRGTAVDAVIDPRDEMLLHTLRDHDWDFALTSYFRHGLEARNVHSQLIRAFLDCRGDFALLDFAAGFGRATRFFVAEHSAPSVWVTDIQTAAVEFQQKQFGVRGIVSSTDPEDFQPPRRFDCVIAHSFFSHVPPARFGPWLKTLNQCVAANGILAFSVHDESPQDGGGRSGSGITFESTSETDRIDSADYGSTWVSASYVGEAVAEHCPGKQLLRLPRGLGNFQDLYVVHENLAAAARLRFDQGPFGYVSICRLAGDELQLIGWASHHNRERSVASIIVEIDGATLQEISSFFPRPDVVEHLGNAIHLRSGWYARFPLPGATSRQTSVLSVRAASDLGVSTTLYLGTIASLLLQSCRAELAAAGREAIVFPDPTGRDPLRQELESLDRNERAVELE